MPVRVTPSKVAEPSDASISEEEDTAIPISVARKITLHMPVDETKPFVVGDRLSDKDIIVWLNHKLYHNEVVEPRAWTSAVTYIVCRLNIMRKYEGRKGANHTTVGLPWRHHHILIVNSDDRKVLRLFLCAMDYRVPEWAFKDHIWEPLPSTSLVRPMLKRLSSNVVSGSNGGRCHYYLTAVGRFPC